MIRCLYWQREANTRGGEGMTPLTKLNGSNLNQENYSHNPLVISNPLGSYFDFEGLDF